MVNVESVYLEKYPFPSEASHNMAAFKSHRKEEGLVQRPQLYALVIWTLFFTTV